MGEGGTVADNPNRRWIDTYLIIPRWALTLFYGLLSLLGAVAVINGIPTLDFTTGPTYVVVWAFLLFLASGTCGAASIHDSRKTAEKWAGIFLVGLLSIYLISAVVVLLLHPSAGRGVAVILVLIISILPALRVTALILGKG